MRKFVAGVDLFCGAGGLSLGLRWAGVRVTAGIDVDPSCEYAFSFNNSSRFLLRDVRDISGDALADLYPPDSIRLLAGCAPCQPFSPFRRGADTSHETKWGLLREFSRLVTELRPELVTMENVPRLGSTSIFHELLQTLGELGYHLDWKSVYCPRFGLPQNRRRLVLLASLIGPVKVPTGPLSPARFKTVRDALSSLPPIEAGTCDSTDPLHKARGVSNVNLQRLKASRPGGTWEDWPKELRSPCHRRRSGKTFRNVYSRMSWDEPAPTITTECYNFGTGRFGHPEQDRSLSLREAALLQGFPRTYQFTRPGEPVHLSRLGRLIGNAVPPALAFFVGRSLMRTVEANYPDTERVCRHPT